MSRCPLCGRKDCCGGYYQEVQDVLVETLKGAKWLIESYVAKPESYEEYQDVVKAIGKWGGEMQCASASFTGTKNTALRTSY